MSEGGEHTPETRPQTAKEKSKEFIKDSYYRLKVLGLDAFASGAFLTMAVNSYSQPNKTAAILSGLASGVMAFVSANEGVRLGSRIKNLSEENTKLKEKLIIMDTPINDYKQIILKFLRQLSTQMTKKLLSINSQAVFTCYRLLISFNPYH